MANGMGLRNYYFDPTYSRSNGYRSVANTILAQEQSGDVFLAHFPDPAWGYYLRHADLPTVMQPAAPDSAPSDTEAALQTITETYERIWFVPYVPSVWDADNVVGRWLDYHLLHASQTQHQKLTLWSYRPLRTANEVTTPVDTSLNGEIILHAAYITVNGDPVKLSQPLSVSSGDTLSVSLIWSAPELVSDDYTVFVHLLADDGFLVAQHDGTPLIGTRPTTTWLPNEQLLDRYQLQIAETGFTGNGRLLIGMYRPDTLERLPFANGETALEIAPVIINP
jgi:hypothetical protein